MQETKLRRMVYISTCACMVSAPSMSVEHAGGSQGLRPVYRSAPVESKPSSAVDQDQHK